MNLCFVRIKLIHVKRVFTWDPKWNLPEMKFQPTMKRIPFALLFTAGEMKWVSFRGWSEVNDPLSKSQSFLLTHARMFPFIWFHFGCCLHDILSSEMKFYFCQKWPQWSKTCNEFQFGLYHVNSYKRLTRHRNENISFRPKWNIM